MSIFQFSLSRPCICYNTKAMSDAAAPSSATQEQLDAIAAQGAVIGQLKTDGASKEDILAAVAILRELKVAAGIDPDAGGRKKKKKKKKPEVQAVLDPCRLAWLG